MSGQECPLQTGRAVENVVNRRNYTVLGMWWRAKGKYIFKWR
jgi:hypothetical protein